MFRAQGVRASNGSVGQIMIFNLKFRSARDSYSDEDTSLSLRTRTHWQGGCKFLSPDMVRACHYALKSLQLSAQTARDGMHRRDWCWLRQARVFEKRKDYSGAFGPTARAAAGRGPQTRKNICKPVCEPVCTRVCSRSSETDSTTDSCAL